MKYNRSKIACYQTELKEYCNHNDIRYEYNPLTQKYTFYIYTVYQLTPIKLLIEEYVKYETSRI